MRLTVEVSHVQEGKVIAERAGCMSANLQQESEVPIGESLWHFFSGGADNLTIARPAVMSLYSAGQWDTEIVEELTAEAFR